jgi:hypothetical protein
VVTTPGGLVAIGRAHIIFENTDPCCLHLFRHVHGGVQVGEDNAADHVVAGFGGLGVKPGGDVKPRVKIHRLQS